ncbi:MAG: prephenate dehydrogenase [bacterium]|nr:prephenate dehydrogenase [bacterium]
MTVLFRKMVIIGVGLIGGSLGLAGKARGLCDEVVGVGRNRANLEKAMEVGAVDRILRNHEEACVGADLVMLATPVEGILSIGQEIAPRLAPGAILTDAGSVKEALVAPLEAAVAPGAFFVGGHPIAGSEASGAAAARADLFEGARTILTPTGLSESGAVSRVRSLWEGVGSQVIEMDVAEHDRVLAAVSHLPHVAAYALTRTLLGMEATRPDIASYAAGGFKDITRIASSHPDIWRDICKMNKKNIVDMIESYEHALEQIKFQIQRNDFGKLSQTFQEARTFRKRL